MSVITFTEKTATPSTPVTGRDKLYFKIDGFLYYLDDAGVENQVAPASSVITPTLANVSAQSDDTAKSLYTMSSAVNVEFEDSSNNTLFYLDETAKEAQQRRSVTNNSLLYQSFETMQSQREDIQKLRELMK